MSTITQFDTRSVRPWDKPQPDTYAVVKFPRGFVAPPRLPHGLRQLDIDRSANIRAKSTIKDIRNDSAEFHITSWADTKLYTGIVNALNLAPANLEFLTGEHMRNLLADPNAPSAVRINFARPFVTPPKVVVFFNLIDLDRTKNWRLETTATKIDTKGFTINIETWSDTILYAAQACWIAYPEDREHIFSTSVNTKEVRPWDKPQHKHSKAITFGNVEFWKTPNVFVALNVIDFKSTANLRVNAYVDGVTTGGLTWHIDSWADTVLYSTGATIIAVN
jgi:hypothetical protein